MKLCLGICQQTDLYPDHRFDRSSVSTEVKNCIESDHRYDRSSVPTEVKNCIKSNLI